MVAGDLVNTASRVQSVAEPGTVFVGESTRRATEQTVVYEEAGAFELKGKDGLLPLWRALRVVSGARGSLKSTGLEAPVRRPRPGTAPDQGPLPHLCRGAQGASDLGHRDRRDRQVAPRLGVLQVLRRPAAAHVLAPRPLSCLRRRRHLLGARGHGADALPDRRRRGAGYCAREAARDARGAHPRSRGAAVRRAARRAAARAGRAGGARQAGAVRRLAALLRAARRRLPHRARVRGHAVGGREPARLRRVPARMVAQLAAVRDHAGAPGAARAPDELGRRPAQLQLALPRAALGRARWRSS